MDQLFPTHRQALTDTDLLNLYAWPEHQHLRANMVTTIDGVVRGPDDRSESISSGADKRVFHLLRGTCDALIVGAGTARTENYRALPAHGKWQHWQSARQHRDIPPVVVVSNRGEFDPHARLFDGPPRSVIVVVPEAAAAHVHTSLPTSIEVLVLGAVTVDLASLLSHLAQRGRTRLLTEGGPTLLAALWPDVDELCLTTTPHILGGIGAPRPSPDLFGGRSLAHDTRPIALRHLIAADGTLLASWQRQTAPPS